MGPAQLQLLPGEGINLAGSFGGCHTLTGRPAAHAVGPDSVLLHQGIKQASCSSGDVEVSSRSDLIVTGYRTSKPFGRLKTRFHGDSWQLNALFAHGQPIPGALGACRTVHEHTHSKRVPHLFSRNPDRTRCGGSKKEANGVVGQMDEEVGVLDAGMLNVDGRGIRIWHDKLIHENLLLQSLALQQAYALRMDLQQSDDCDGDFDRDKT